MALVYLSKQTASNSTSLTFTNLNTTVGSRYGVLEFHLKNIRPVTGYVDFQFQVKDQWNTTGFDETITSTFVGAFHTETQSNWSLYYDTSRDQKNSTAYQTISLNCGNDSDETSAGILRFYNPQSDNKRLNFIARVNGQGQDSSNSTQYTRDNYPAGYFKCQDLDEINFKFSSGNISIGEILMYGVKI